VLTQTPDAFEVNVAECRYARFRMTEGFGGNSPGPQTIMQGASHCDFRYALKRRDGTNGTVSGE
jgi:hypothetical protein